MRPPPDREPRPPAPAWSAGAAVPSSTPGSSNPAPSHAIPSLKESIGSAHASITHAELSGKYTNLKKRYFALDDVSIHIHSHIDAMTDVFGIVTVSVRRRHRAS